MSDFIHLHVHTEYSLLDGLSKIPRLVKHAKELNMTSLAITDHGTMFGVMDFYRACKDADIKPIIGVEAYLAKRTRFDREREDRKPYHMLLLAKNQTGYQNLLKIATEAQLSGFYYNPRIDREFLAEHAEGLIATSGCLAAQIPNAVMEGRDDEARELIGWYQDVFGKENFFLELQQHDIEELRMVNNWLVQNRDYADIQFVATNDVHYVLDEDYDPHDTLLCIQTSELKRTPRDNRLAMSDASYHLKSQAEMWRDFGHIRDGEALKNTLKIAEMCEVDLDPKGYHLPIFPVPRGYTADTYLRYLAEKGMTWRYGDNWHNDPVLTERLERELSIIHNMGFDTYFLIVWDLCQYARKADIWWNVRGSGAGSVVAYALDITSIDPIINNLLFERFLNPGRVSMPDIDLDYPDDRRGEMIEYTARKYGEDKVAAIITFGTMGPKAAVRDVGRALDVPLAEVNKAAKLIPTEPKPKPLMTYVESNPELLELYNSTPDIRRVIDTARDLQGITRHASTHAAGVIVADRPLVEYLPLHRPTKGEKGEEEASSLKAVTQFPMETCESIGLLKIDFLGLSTLTILRKACDLIARHHGIHYNMQNIPYRHEHVADSPEWTEALDKAFELVGRGDTVGVFQVESTGMQQMLRGMRPTKFEHIIAAISLYRPGPMDYIPTFNRRMQGEEEVHYHHEKLKPILAETYGIMTYQEQLMQIASDLFGYELGEADLMRRAVSKKKEKDLLKHKAIFIERGPQYGIDAETSERIFADIEFFANYGFNKCVTAGTKILDATTGRLVSIGDLVSGAAQVVQTVTCDTDRLRLQTGVITAVMENGVKPVYRLTTQTGRQIEATANHPFLAFNGWRMLAELQSGDHIATPRRLPVEGKKTWADHELIVLGHLLAEGNLCHTTGVYYYTTNDEQLEDYVRHMEMFVNSIASVSRHKSAYSVYSKRIQRSQPQGLVEWIKSLGLWGKDSHTKFIPDEVFELNNRQIALLISRLWEGDGHINVKGRSLYYATASERLARQLQHLFLRLGIVTSLRQVEFPYKDGRIGYQLFVTGNDQFKIFLEHVACHFVSDERREKLKSMIILNPISGSSIDIVPLDVRHLVANQRTLHQVTWKEVSQHTGLDTRYFSRAAPTTKAGFTRPVISQLADYFGCEALKIQAENDIYWDRIVSIDYIGEQPTYDLTIADTHNFVANDIIVHNSHAADYAVITVQTAFLKAHYPAEYMTALLTVHRDDSTKVAVFMEECRRLGIAILPPDVNHSMLDFDIQQQEDGTPAIRFGLAAVKNAGVGSLQHILDAREKDGPFRDLQSFCQRVDLRAVGKRALEHLIKVGAMRDFGKRTQLLAGLERMVSYSANYHKEKEIGQINMFGGDTSMAEEILENLPDMAEVSQRDMLTWEKELLGLYVTGRPVDKYSEQLRFANTTVIAHLKEQDAAMNGRQVVVAGEVVSLRKIVTKNGDMMCVIHLEDWHDSAAALDVVIFPRTWLTCQEIVTEGEILRVVGKFDTSRGDPQIIAETVDQNFNIVTPDMDNGHYPPAASAPPAWAVDDDAPPWALDDDMPPAWETGYTPPAPVYEAPPEENAPSAPATNGSEHSPAHTNGGNGHDSYWQPEEVHEDQQRFLYICLHRTGDSEQDARRLKRISNTLLKYPGQDRFAILVKSSGKTVRMEFKERTTGVCDSLLRELAAIVGENNVEVAAELAH